MHVCSVFSLLRCDAVALCQQFLVPWRYVSSFWRRPSEDCAAFSSPSRRNEQGSSKRQDSPESHLWRTETTIVHLYIIVLLGYPLNPQFFCYRDEKMILRTSVTESLQMWVPCRALNLVRHWGRWVQGRVSYIHTRTWLFDTAGRYIRSSRSVYRSEEYSVGQRQLPL